MGFDFGIQGAGKAGGFEVTPGVRVRGGAREIEKPGAIHLGMPAGNARGYAEANKLAEQARALDAGAREAYENDDQALGDRLSERAQKVQGLARGKHAETAGRVQSGFTVTPGPGAVPRGSEERRDRARRQQNRRDRIARQEKAEAGRIEAIENRAAAYEYDAQNAAQGGNQRRAAWATAQANKQKRIAAEHKKDLEHKQTRRKEVEEFYEDYAAKTKKKNQVSRDRKKKRREDADARRGVREAARRERRKRAAEDAADGGPGGSDTPEGSGSGGMNAQPVSEGAEVISGGNAPPEPNNEESQPDDAGGYGSPGGTWGSGNAANTPTGAMGGPGGGATVEDQMSLIRVGLNAVRAVTMGAFGGPHMLAANIGLNEENREGKAIAGSTIGTTQYGYASPTAGAAGGGSGSGSLAAGGAAVGAASGCGPCTPPTLAVHSVVAAEAGSSMSLAGGGIFQVIREIRGAGAETVADVRPLILLENNRGPLHSVSGDMLAAVDRLFAVNADSGVQATAMSVQVPTGQDAGSASGNLLEVGHVANNLAGQVLAGQNMAPYVAVGPTGEMAISEPLCVENQESANAVDAPEAGTVKLFAVAGGMYVKESDGTETGPLGAAGGTGIQDTLHFNELANVGAADTPASGDHGLFFLDTGLYSIDDAAVVTGPYTLASSVGEVAINTIGGNAADGTITDSAGTNTYAATINADDYTLTGGDTLTNTTTAALVVRATDSITLSTGILEMAGMGSNGASTTGPTGTQGATGGDAGSITAGGGGGGGGGAGDDGGTPENGYAGVDGIGRSVAMLGTGGGGAAGTGGAKGTGAGSGSTAGAAVAASATSNAAQLATMFAVVGSWASLLFGGGSGGGGGAGGSTTGTQAASGALSVAGTIGVSAGDGGGGGGASTGGGITILETPGAWSINTADINNMGAQVTGKGGNGNGHGGGGGGGGAGGGGAFVTMSVSADPTSRPTPDVQAGTTGGKGNGGFGSPGGGDGTVGAAGEAGHDLTINLLA